MKAIDYSVLIMWSKEDEAFLAQVLELSGCVADGATREEALANAVIAAQNWIETAKEIGREIPEPMSFDRFERPLKDDLEAQLKRAVANELDKIIPELVARVTAITHGLRTVEGAGVLIASGNIYDRNIIMGPTSPALSKKTLAEKE